MRDIIITQAVLWGSVYMIYADVSSDERAAGGRRPPTNLIHHQIIVALISIAAL